MSTRFARLLGAALLPATLWACGTPVVAVELIFPDEGSRADTNGFVLTAVEPFVAGPQDSGRDRVLLKCGELSVFGPYAKVNRDVSDLPNLQVLMNREPQEFGADKPFKWDLSLEKFKSSEETNPWRAVMVHFEARGFARKSDGGLALADEPKTLLEGCYCMRLNADATSSDLALDADVKKACPAVGEAGGEKRRVELTAVARTDFRLAPCGVTQLTAARDRVTTLNPGVCVRATICGTGGTTSGCFSCSTQKCPELDDLKNVPVRITVEQENGQSTADPHIILSNKGGRVAPEVALDECRTPVVVHAEIVGRPDQKVDFPISCVSPVDFDATPTGEEPVGNATAPTVIAITTIPKVVDAQNQVLVPARVAVLVSANGAAKVEVYEPRPGNLGIHRVASAQWGGRMGEEERPYAALGYHYKTGPMIQDKSKPLLAIISAKPTKPGRPIVRLLEMREENVPENERLRLVSSTTIGDPGPHGMADPFCPYSSCAGTGDCQTPPCTAALDLTAVSAVSIAAADINGDGLSELAFGTDRLFHLTTFYTRVSDGAYPPRGLMDHCACSSLGRGLPSFDLVQLGGVGLATENRVDLLMGDGTGAYVRYAGAEDLTQHTFDNTFDGDTCVPGAAGDCPANFECWTPCGTLPISAAFGRCVKRCNKATLAQDCAGFPAGTTCTPTVGPSSGSLGFCATPNIGCKSPSAVWPLITIHDVTKGHIAGGRFDDAIAVGAGSPVPGFTGTGFVRIMFGSGIDLSKLMSLPEDQRNASSVDLIPRRLYNAEAKATEDAQGPRSAEVGDFNGDGIDDVAVLYTGTEEVRVWLGSLRQAPGEIGEQKQKRGDGTTGRIRLTNCQGTCGPSEKCFPFQRFAVADLDGDGRSEVLAVCVPENGNSASPTLKWYIPKGE